MFFIFRLWSDYLYLGKYFKYKNKTSPEAFHANAVDAIKMFQDCLKYFTPRGCAYNGSIGSIEVNIILLFITYRYILYAK